MPRYDYKCKSCNIQFEIEQLMTEDPLTECPDCKGDVFRVIGSAGIIFKGSGFYVTDKKTTTSARPSQTKESSSSSTDTKSSNVSKSAT